MPIVENRYAEALLSVTASAEAADRIESVLKDFSVLWASHEELRVFLLSPVVPPEAKKETLRQILSTDTFPTLVNFLYLLTDKGRLSLLPAIYGEYRRLKSKWRQALDIHVCSAQPLDESQLNKIRDKYTQQYGAASAKIQHTVDSSLLGGVRVQIGDTLIDDTLLGRLQGLLSAMES